MSMTREKIEKSIKEAERFILAAHGLLGALDGDVDARDLRYDRMEAAGYTERITPGNSPSDHSWGCAESGALRRSSMDLTRQLAELRK